MTEEQTRDAAKYLGCKCEIYSIRLGYIWEIRPLNILDLSEHYFEGERLSTFRLLLTDIADLTQQDLDRMYNELYPDVLDKKDLDQWHDLFGDILPVAMAEWLRNEGSYYLNEPSIKEFVKTEEPKIEVI